MDVLWSLEPATAAKHRLWKRYLDAWWPIMLQPSPYDGRLRPRVTYLDAFAGPGRYKGGDEGSPVFALRRLLNHDAADRMHLSRDRVRLLFTEKDRQRYQYLRAELGRKLGPLEELPVQAEPFQAEAGRDAESLLEKSGAWGHPILAIFDSWGNVNVPLHLIRRLASNPSTEVIVTFGPNWFNRREHLEPDRLDMVFGGRPVLGTGGPGAAAPASGGGHGWLPTATRCGGRASGTSCSSRSFPHTGQPLYLVFGTKHRRGVEVMKDAMWEVDGNDGMGFADPRTRGGQLADQPTLLWGGAAGSRTARPGPAAA